MKISKAGLDLIKHFEGCLLYGYKDVVGVPTIGYGHTGGVVVGHRITQVEADTLLRHDLDRFEESVDKLVTVNINQHQFDALVAFSFNVGSGALKTSTLLKKVNAKDFTGAAKEFAKWNKGTIDGEKVVLNGLTRRRKAEAELFLKPVPSTAPKYPKHPIEKGDSDHASIKLIQKRLHIDVDGVFGNGTWMAVRNFQAHNGLEVDGVVGKLTWSKLFK
jgi:lysozyme